MRRNALSILLLGVLRVGALSAVPAPLTITGSGPNGEIAKLEESNEIRVTFSEPMVALGRIPDPVTAPFFSIAPPVAGSFRWAGTTTLIFRPARPLPYATRYDVTIAPSATAVSGSRLAEPYAFSFTTPTLKLREVSWYRRSGRSDSAIVLALTFNQPVTRAAIARRLSLRYAPREFTPPPLPNGHERWKALDPAGFAAFEAKIERARAAAAESGPVAVRPAKAWNRKWFSSAPECVVFETVGAPGVGHRISVALGADPGAILALEPIFFVEGLRCETGCDPTDYNPLRFTAPVTPKKLRPAIRLTDVSVTGKPARIPPKAASAGETPDWEPELYPRSTVPGGATSDEWPSQVTLEEVGFSPGPGRTFAVRLAPTLTSQDGQALGYGWIGVVENWHESAFTSFGEGQGVWEASGGPALPFAARNLQSVSQWLAPVEPDALLSTLLPLQSKGFRAAPPTPPVGRRLAPVPDKIQSYALDLKPLLSPKGTGLVWAALQNGEPIPRARKPEGSGISAALVQVTNLGISVKDSPDNTLLFVTRLDDGSPVPGAGVAIRTTDGKVFWSGTTGADGTALAPTEKLRRPDRWWELSFVVTAEKDGDFAYVGSDWNEGSLPWAFSLPFDLEDASPLLRGTVFADRGVYKLGEEAHLKVIARADTPRGVGLLPPGTTLAVVVKDSQGAEVDKRTVKLSAWGTADWAWKLPAEAPLGSYSVSAAAGAFKRPIQGSFLVAAYRRPDFRVDVNLAGETTIASVTLKGVVTGRYLFGAPMADRLVRWTYTRRPLSHVPRAVADRFPEEQWTFLDSETERRGATEPVQTQEGKLDPEGKLAFDLETSLDAGEPYDYALEGEVTDVSRQTIAGRASFRVDPAPWYVGIGRLPYFAEAGKEVETEIVAADLSGNAAAGVAVSIDLKQVQWNSVRRAEGGGFYTWETERKEVDAGHFDVTTTEGPTPLRFAVSSGGYYVLRATARDAQGRSTSTTSGFYALGAGYTAWERYDSNRIDLVTEKTDYRPGEEARILIKSPWEKATALLTVEREGIRSHRTFVLSSTQETVRVPITEADIPNLYVSVLLIKGRTAAYTGEDASDPGRPAFRLGYTELKVENAAKRLTVAIAADKEEYRPAEKARVEVAVTDAAGKPDAAEVTLWAVDYGVLSLTGYKTPDVLDSVYIDKALSVLNEDSRQKIVSRRVTVAKGGNEGGGGGAEEGPEGGVRKDFRVLAFWLGSLVTDAAGKAATEVKLPESLTTYRIMAVAGDKASRFGRGDREIRISKPVLLRAAFPRFLAAGDAATFGAVLNSQLKQKGTAIVTMQSLDPQVLELTGEAKQVLEAGPKSATEVRFPVRAKAPGVARIRMSVSLLGETDAFEESLPVRVLSSPEVVAAYGQADPVARETVAIPAAVVPDVGGLRLELASTALVNLAEGAQYLIEYPYGCAEQRASATLALMLAADLGSAFRLPGIDPQALGDAVRRSLRELAEFQCGSGGFAFWKGGCGTASPYLSSYVLSVLQRAGTLGYAVDAGVLERGYASLLGALGQGPPTDDSWRSSYAAWQAFAVRVLAQGKRNVDSPLTRLYGERDRMPVFALAYLLDALKAKGETGERPAELERRIRNAILPEAGTAHVQELQEPSLLWLWNSNVRSTAIVLGSLVRDTDDRTLVPGLVRWLLRARQRGRWGNTQENAYALSALHDYYRKYEKDVPDFRATVTLGKGTIAAETFEGRDSSARIREVPMKQLLALGDPPETLPLELRKDGTGVLHYGARLTYLPSTPSPGAIDQGIRVERSYALAEGNPPPARSFSAGTLIRVTLTLTLPKERRFLAVTDPLPAGLEPVESWFATTASDLVQGRPESAAQGDWMSWWQRGGFDHVERHDDRVLLFATRLSEGTHTFSYLARATTAGRFGTAPTHAEEMYAPEVFGKAESAVVDVEN